MDGRGGRGAELDECLALYRSGDPGAIDRLCAALRPRIHVYVERRLATLGRRWAEVDDIVQGILLEVVKTELAKLPASTGSEELLQRVQRTAMCRTLDAVRNQQHLVGESALPEPIDATAADVHSAGPVTAEDRRRWLEELVARLPAKYAAVVRLCGFEELTHVEAARRLGLEPDTVRKRYEVARQALARRLGSAENA